MQQTPYITHCVARLALAVVACCLLSACEKRAAEDAVANAKAYESQMQLLGEHSAVVVNDKLMVVLRLTAVNTGSKPIAAMKVVSNVDYGSALQDVQVTTLPAPAAGASPLAAGGGRWATEVRFESKPLSDAAAEQLLLARGNWKSKITEVRFAE